MIQLPRIQHQRRGELLRGELLDSCMGCPVPSVGPSVKIGAAAHGVAYRCRPDTSFDDRTGAVRGTSVFLPGAHQSVTHNSRAMVSMRNLLGKIYCSGQSQSARLGLTSTLLRPLATRRTPCGPSERQRAFWMSWLIGPVRRIRTLMPAWSLARDAVESLQT